MSEYPKYEKVDQENIRIIVEKGDVISLSKLLENKKLVEQKLKELQDKLNYINEVIAEAEKLGIVPEVIVDKPKKEFVSED
jgi:hypothetical protein